MAVKGVIEDLIGVHPNGAAAGSGGCLAVTWGDNGFADDGCADRGESAKQLVSLFPEVNRCCVLSNGTAGSFLRGVPGLIGLVGLCGLKTSAMGGKFIFVGRIGGSMVGDVCC